MNGGFRLGRARRGNITTKTPRTQSYGNRIRPTDLRNPIPSVFWISPELRDLCVFVVIFLLPALLQPLRPSNSKLVKADLAWWDAEGDEHLGAGFDHHRGTAKIVFNCFGILVLIEIIL